MRNQLARGIEPSKILGMSLLALALLFAACASRTEDRSQERDRERLEQFEKKVDEFRALLGIPGMSMVIVKDQKVLGARGFGFADVDGRVPATPETVYHIASFTKTFAATLIMQLVEQGKLDLDEPMSHYSSDFKDDSVRIKHLLSHTSGGATPGERFEYSGSRFDYLTAVIEKKTGKPFREVMVKTFLDPLAMSSSVPGADVVDEADKWVAALGKENLDRYREVLPRQAKPYTLYGAGEIVPVRRTSDNTGSNLTPRWSLP